MPEQLEAHLLAPKTSVDESQLTGVNGVVGALKVAASSLAEEKCPELSIHVVVQNTPPDSAASFYVFDEWKRQKTRAVDMDEAKNADDTRDHPSMARRNTFICDIDTSTRCVAGIRLQRLAGQVLGP